LKRYPRPTDENTNVIYTTYDLPRVAAKPHDVQIGPEGWIYYGDFNAQIFGKLNPKTGATVEWDILEKLPQLDEEGDMMPAGNRVVMYDGQGKFYLSPPGLRGGEGYVITFDTKTEKFDYYPGGGHFVVPYSISADGYAWINRGGQVSRVKFLRDGKMTKEVVGEKLGAYDTYADSKNNVYGASRESTQFWRVDAKTLKVSHYAIPKQPRGETGLGNPGPRRGLFDRQDRLWFGGFDGNVIGKLDPSKPADSAIELFPIPLPWFQPYQAQSDDAGYVWTGSISADHVARMNEKTGKWNMYLLPGETNIRQIRVQRSESGGLSSLWVGANHQGQIVHIEPLAP
jgi:streptogramin lyase